jgi:hypothetical protein
MNLIRKSKTKSQTTLYYNNSRKSSSFHPYFQLIKPLKAKIKLSKYKERIDIIYLDFLFKFLKINQ